MTISEYGSLGFGTVIGWYVYYINRYRKSDVQISDITTLIGAIGGAAIMVLFKGSGTGGELFGAYGVGLAIGFFSYYLALVILVARSQNFDSDWFLDGRRRAPSPDSGYDRDQAGLAMAPQPAAATTQIFNVGTAPQVAMQPSAVMSPMDVSMAESVVMSGPSDEDPAMPIADEISETADFDSARVLSNLGGGSVEEQLDDPTAMALSAGLKVDAVAVQAFAKACMTSSPRVTYGLGAKVPFHGAKPGVQFTKIDCSGFVREAIRSATNPMVAFPDGSVVQHDWVRNRGFKRVSIGEGALKDNVMRIAFLRPQDSPHKIGHVVLLFQGQTFESHGGVGPDSRVWSGAGWQAKAFVYILG